MKCLESHQIRTTVKFVAASPRQILLCILDTILHLTNNIARNPLIYRRRLSIKSRQLNDLNYCIVETRELMYPFGNLWLNLLSIVLNCFASCM
jgi:hypothetical protein